MKTFENHPRARPASSLPRAGRQAWAGRLGVLAVLTATLLLGACAVGNTYEYRIPSMPLPVKGSANLGLVVSDERVYIRNHDKTPDFVGLQRGGFGNPFDVRTTSGRPMAQDMAETLKVALQAQGFHVTLIDGSGEDLAALGHQAGAQGLQRVVVLHIKDWKTDTAARAKLFFDLQLLIVDPAGKVLAQNQVNGAAPIGGGMPKAISGLAQQEFENKIGQLFYPPAIRAALSDEHGAPTGGR